MINPNYKSRSDDFKRLFKDLPDSERLIVGELYSVIFYSLFFNISNFINNCFIYLFLIAMFYKSQGLIKVQLCLLKGKLLKN